MLLEVTAQVVWWGQDCLEIFDKEVCLLPRPLLTKAQLEQLDAVENDKSLYHQFDPILGWSISPNRRVFRDGVMYESNGNGIRGQRDYTQTPPPGVTRLAAFGPSFAHSTEVGNEASWTYLLEQSLPNLEVMNWGVGGYGTDQAFLRYTTQGAAYHPQIVIIVYEEENLRRNVNRFRPFYSSDTSTPLTKPVFILKDDGLELLANPFQSLSTLRDTALNAPGRFLDLVCPYDYYCTRELYQPSPLDIFKSYRFLHTLTFEIRYRDGLPSYETPLFENYLDKRLSETTLRLIYLFVATVRQNGSIPVVITFPRRGTVEHYSYGDLPIFHEAVVQLQREGIHTLDLTRFFVEANEGGHDFSRFFAPGGHYSEAGNRVVSDALLNYLCQADLLKGCDSP